MTDLFRFDLDDAEKPVDSDPVLSRPRPRIFCGPFPSPF
jgi:hypothetical protein